jgi:hypothetical protein
MNMVLPFTKRGLVLAAMVSVLSPSWGRAQPAVREWPDPGYRRLGVYGSGPDSYFDYQLVKLHLGDIFPEKKAYWAGLKSSAGRRNASRRHNIYFIYCGERSETLETCKARVDAWLAPEADLPTHPELIPAICLGEENVSSRNAVLDGLARHIRETYGIPVFQFYSMPLSPSPDLTADGWVFDAYGMQDVQFRKHLMKFVALGKPVVCIPWASDPHWPGWTRSENTAAMIDREWGQFPICMEFDVSCAVFAVAGPGAINPWLSSQTPDMVQLRNCLRTKRQQMHALSEDDLPLATANFSARDRSVPVGGDAGSPSVYEEHFSGFAWIHDADVQGFLNLQLTSKPDPVGFLNMNTRAEEVTRAALTWRFESYFPLEEVQITLDAAAPPAADCRNTLSLGTDELGGDWLHRTEQTDAGDIQSVMLHATEALRGRRAFYVRLEMENRANRAGLAGNRIDRLRVECVHRSPPGGATAELIADDYGNLFYEDDFSTTRWRHFGEMKAAHPSHSGWRGGDLWVGMVGGYATSTELLQRFSSPRPLKELVVTADCYADGKNLGGQAVVQVGPRDSEPKWQIASQGLHKGHLRVEIPADEINDLQQFDVRVVLRSTSGVEQGTKACATLRSLLVQGR